jgi:Rab proteins geranylgeranyltransferase component A
VVTSEESKGDGARKLGFSRAYSLALAPQIIYTRSNLIPVLVSSKVYRQLDFMAVGSWWVYDATTAREGSAKEAASSLRKIPSRREDIFEDKTLDLKAKRALIKFLRLAMDADAHAAAVEQFGDVDLESYLTRQFGIPLPLQAGLHALTLSPQSATKTPLSYALPRITRHLGSFGVFGTGFSAVIPKWGGAAEIAQVGCRALAVGGGVYMLGTGVREQHPPATEGSNLDVALDLESGDTVRTAWVAGSHSAPSGAGGLDSSTRSITIVTSGLAPIFSSLGDGAPKPAAAVVTFPAGSLDDSDSANVPVYLMIHSSETGECPTGQGMYINPYLLLRLSQ